ncbi:MAG: hypothetical protein R3E66_13960 [bacterium]
MAIPSEVLERTPLITDAGFSRLSDLIQHPDAPRWNHQLGDRLKADDLEAANAFRRDIIDRTHPWLAAFLERHRKTTWWFEANLPHRPMEQWAAIPTMGREDIAQRLHLIVPHDADLTEVLSYTTSGTTGHAITVPSHPRTLALNQTLAERALSAWDAHVPFGPECTVLQVCERRETYQFANTFSVWNQTAFAKINLRDDHWNNGLDAAKRFIESINPALITGDPAAFVALAALAPAVTPHAMFSTATTLDDHTRTIIDAQCPLIDWYSCTETGPIAFKNRLGKWEFIAPDLKVEVIDAAGEPCALGTEGDVAVTGGRNPYLPLLRYRTGDRAVLAADGSGFERLHGRHEVIFETPNGRVQGIDIARAMRERSAFLQHRVVQHSNGSFTVTIRPMKGLTDARALREAVHEVVGTSVVLVEDGELGVDGKVTCFEVEP